MEWQIHNAESEERVEEYNIALIPQKEHLREDCRYAKNKELEAWKKYEAFKEVKDVGQERFSHRWILVEKEADGEKYTKARLVFGGFEETIDIQSDSPTGSKETLHLTLAISSSKSWDICSLDVKNTYLQGEELQRTVFMEPPKEMKKLGIIWQIFKSVYGMNDAGRRWFLKVKTCLEKLKCAQSSLDPCLFFYHRDQNRSGILIIWVDNFFYSGDGNQEKEVVQEVEKSFQIGRTDHSKFLYTGLPIEKMSTGITIDQIGYSEKIRPVDLTF